MGIFHTLKNLEQPVSLKHLNQYLRFRVKLAEAKTSVLFLKECCVKQTYPKPFWTILRRHGIKVTARSLKRQAKNEMETIEAQIPVYEQNIALQETALSELPSHLKSSLLTTLMMLLKNVTRC